MSKNVTWSDRNINYSSRLTEQADQLIRLRLICICQCFNQETYMDCREQEIYIHVCLYFLYKFLTFLVPKNE